MDISVIILLAVLVVITVLAYLYNKGRTALLKEKKEVYMNAIKSGNRFKALEAGREYYSCLKKLFKNRILNYQQTKPLVNLNN